MNASSIQPILRLRFEGTELPRGSEVRLYMEGRSEPIYTWTTPADDDAWLDIVNVYDETLNRWLRSADFQGEDFSSSHYNAKFALETLRLERFLDVPLVRRTVLCRPADSRVNNCRDWVVVDAEPFVSEILERERVAEEKSREVQEAEDARRQRREANPDLVGAIAGLALQQLPIPDDLITQLRDLDVLEPSTRFRSHALHPGETWVLRLDNVIEGHEVHGWLGFDEEYELISVQTGPEPYELRLYQGQPYKL